MDTYGGEAGIGTGALAITWQWTGFAWEGLACAVILRLSPPLGLLGEIEKWLVSLVIV